MVECRIQTIGIYCIHEQDTLTLCWYFLECIIFAMSQYDLKMLTCMFRIKSNKQINKILCPKINV